MRFVDVIPTLFRTGPIEPEPSQRQSEESFANALPASFLWVSCVELEVTQVD
jgi:hypothetical protein